MDKRCGLIVNTIGGTDTSSWYDIYKALIAVNVICTHDEPSLGGIATHIGVFRSPLTSPEVQVEGTRW